MTDRVGHVFVRYDESGAVSKTKTLPELIAQAGPFLTAMHEAHEGLNFQRSDVSKGIALLVQEKQAKWGLKDHEVDDFAATMTVRSMSIMRVAAQGMLKSPKASWVRSLPWNLERSSPP